MSAPAAPAAQLPTFEALRSAHQPARLTDAFLRLLWTLQGPLSTSIMVMAEKQNPDTPREAYFRQTLAGTTWHPVADEALTQPPVSSITVGVYHLDMWADDWEEHHRHAEPGGAGCVFGPVDGQEQEQESGGGGRDEGDDDDDEQILLRCCGEDRPKDHVPLVVTAPPSSGRQHVTVHDYVSAVHPWLMAQRDEILAAKDVWEEGLLPADTKLAVNYHGVDHLMITELEDWLQSMRVGLLIPQFYDGPRHVPEHLNFNPNFLSGFSMPARVLFQRED